MKEEKAWLIIDDQDSDCLVGNKNGLLKLKDTIEKLLQSKEAESLGFIEDSNVCNVLLRNKADYLKTPAAIKSTFFEKVTSALLAFWFIVLPFVAIAFILFTIFDEPSRGNEENIQPLINAMKIDCEKSHNQKLQKIQAEEKNESLN